MDYFSEITQLKGIGEKTSACFHKLGIYTVYDLITYYPRDYEGYEAISDSSECEAYCKSDSPIALKLCIKSNPTLRYVKKMKIVSCIGEDQNGAVELSWFNMPYLAKTLNAGSVYVFYGKLSRKGASYNMTQPKMMKVSEYEQLVGRLLPVYSVTKGITSQTIQKMVKLSLTTLPKLSEYLNEEASMMDINEAIVSMHFPKDYETLIKARKRLVFDEFYTFICMVRQAKEGERRIPNTFPCMEVAQTKRLIEKLPYKLTAAQLKCFDEILADLSGEYIMNRLVQGDVGSGKTIVAVLAMLTCAANGYQAAIMAPTEVLARQHMQSISEMVKEFGINCVCLTGSLSAKDKREAKQKIASGEANIVIGTHALIQDGVEFKNLALAITDEQHRFGVRQRENLGKNVHVLVMSATPIPRTLAIILYGDLDISIIDEKPAERLPIKNCVVGPNFRQKAYQFIEKEVNAGHQALVVCPMVEESESLEAENVIDYTEKLRRELAPAFCIEYLHGKMKNADKNTIMQRFAEGDIDVLVSTTVIEVGINVPNTTVMMVENSERFGLSQLHQLRGRVGRGDAQSYCIFMCGKESKDALLKLDILNKSNDGFEIARQDLKQRGPGDMFGFRQSGDLSFKIGDIFTDADILKAASEYADKYPDKALSSHAPAFSRNLTL